MIGKVIKSDVKCKTRSRKPAVLWQVVFGNNSTETWTQYHRFISTASVNGRQNHVLPLLFSALSLVPDSQVESRKHGTTNHHRVMTIGVVRMYSFPTRLCRNSATVNPIIFCIFRAINFASFLPYSFHEKVKGKVIPGL